MKKLLLTAGLVALTTAAFAQGSVNFANATSAYGAVTPSHLLTWADSATNFNALLTPGSLVSSNFAGVIVPGLRAQLYYGASTANSLAGMTAEPNLANFRSSTSANAGSWLGGTRTLTGYNPGDNLMLAVVVFDTAFAANGLDAYNQFQAHTYGGLFGWSGLFSYLAPLPGAPVTAYLPANQLPFSVGAVLIPEPATFALAGLGAAALLIFRRRK